MLNDAELHELALKRAKTFRIAESDLIDVLQTVDERRLWEKRGFTSLHDYTVRALELSEDNAYCFTRVARKAREIPEIKEAIADGRLNVSTARRIVSVITPETKNEWIEKASTLKQRELQREIAKENPRAATPDTIKFVAESWMEIKGGVSPETAQAIRRAQELEAQRTGRSVSFDEAIRAMAEVYLEKKDPVRKAERNLGKQAGNVFASRRTIPAKVKHEVMARDRGQCTHVNERGVRCPSRKWLQVHHKVEWAEGGNHRAENLATLCYYHHKYRHGNSGKHPLTASY